MELKKGVTPEGGQVIFLAGDDRDESHDCQLREKGFCGCANAIEAEE